MTFDRTFRPAIWQDLLSETVTKEGKRFLSSSFHGCGVNECASQMLAAIFQPAVHRPPRNRSFGTNIYVRMCVYFESSNRPRRSLRRFLLLSQSDLLERQNRETILPSLEYTTADSTAEPANRVASTEGQKGDVGFV